MREKIKTLSKRTLVHDTITTTLWSTLGKGAGFLIPFFIASWFGVDKETDAFFFAYGFILLLSGIFAPVVEAVIVPYIAEKRSKNDDVGKFVGSIFVFASISIATLLIGFFLITKPVLTVLTSFDNNSVELVFQLLCETAPLVLLLTYTSILAGVLNSFRRFSLPALSPAFRACVNLLIIFAFKDAYGVHAIAFGYLLGELVRFIILLLVIKKMRLYKLRFSFKLDRKLKEFMRTALYQIIGMVALGTVPVIDKIIASWLEEGSISILHYGERLFMIPITFLTAGLIVTVLSHWSTTYYDTGKEKLRTDMSRVLKVSGLVALAILMLLVLANKWIVRLAFGHGRITDAELFQVRWVWLCYMVGFVPYILDQVYVRGHLVLRNTKTLMNCAFYMISIGIVLKLILVKLLGLKGIALATSIVYVLMFYYLKIIFKKRTKDDCQ